MHSPGGLVERRQRDLRRGGLLAEGAERRDVRRREGQEDDRDEREGGGSAGHGCN